MLFILLLPVLFILPGYTGPPSPGFGNGITGTLSILSCILPFVLPGYTGPPSPGFGSGVTGTLSCAAPVSYDVVILSCTIVSHLFLFFIYLYHIQKDVNWFIIPAQLPVRIQELIAHLRSKLHPYYSAVYVFQVSL